MSRSAPADGGGPVAVTAGLLRSRPLAAPDENGGKEERGRVLVVGGSAETPGAVILAGLAALRAGAGKLRIATTAAAAPTVAVAVPEALVAGLPETAGGELAVGGADRVVELAERSAAVLVGPGMRRGDQPDALVDALVRRIDAPVLIADAQAAVTVRRPRAGGHLVLTPNSAEAASLLGRPPDEVARDLEAAARDIAAGLGTVVAVRDAETWVVDGPGPAYRDRGGTVGLATSGSGDVLAGIVAGLAARAGDPVAALLWAVHVHGRAGERLSLRVGRMGFLARELLDEVPRVITELSGW